MAELGSMSFNSMSMGANGVGVVSVVDETKTFARFIIEPKLMIFESEQAGHPVYENKEYIFVHHPGERDPIKKEATEFDRLRWPQAYARFKEGQKEAPPGTNLAVIFPSSPNIAATFAALGIHTVEQLAVVSDGALGNMPFGFDSRAKAKKYLEQQNGAEGFNKHEAELEAAKKEVRSLELRMTEMAEQMARLKDEQSKSASSQPAQGGMQPADVLALMQTFMAQQQADPPKRGPGRPPKET